MPCLDDGPNGRRTVNGPLLSVFIDRCNPGLAYVEHVSSRPGEGAVGAFAFGQSFGIVKGVLAHARIPVSFITPPAQDAKVSDRRQLGLLRDLVGQVRAVFLDDGFEPQDEEHGEANEQTTEPV
jgi:hypothetical protein